MLVPMSSNLRSLRRISTDALREGLKYLEKEKQVIAAKLSQKEIVAVDELVTSRHSIERAIEGIQETRARTIYRIPRLHGMETNEQWCRALGPQLVKHFLQSTLIT